MKRLDTDTMTKVVSKIILKFGPSVLKNVNRFWYALRYYLNSPKFEIERNYLYFFVYLGIGEKLSGDLPEDDEEKKKLYSYCINSLVESYNWHPDKAYLVTKVFVSALGQDVALVPYPQEAADELKKKNLRLNVTKAPQVKPDTDNVTKAPDITVDYTAALKFYRSQAEQGDAAAQYYLGLCYSEGISRNYAEAVEWFNKSAAQGYTDAQYKLGACCSDGVGLMQDYTAAVQWFRIAADKGHTDALYRLGCCYYYGNGVEKDYDEAVKLFTQAVKQGHTYAQAMLSDRARQRYFSSIAAASASQAEPEIDANKEGYKNRSADLSDLDPDSDAQDKADDEFLNTVQNLSDQQEPTKEQPNTNRPKSAWPSFFKVLFTSGVILTFVVFLLYSIMVTVCCIESDKKLGEFGYTLGQAYHHGVKYEQDYKKAVQYYLEAAEVGNAEAQFVLGLCYKNGKGVKQNPTEAVKWFLAAAQKGHTRESKFRRSFPWLFRSAAENDHAKAQDILGTCYAAGDGVKQNNVEAVKWYRQAAEQGLPLGEYHLGNCYYYGKGVGKNSGEAAMWYRKAFNGAEYGSELKSDAKKHLAEALFSLGNSRQGIEAFKAYKESAELGHVRAQYEIGKIYDAGDGVNQDYTEAIKWYRKAANQGHAESQYKLGKCYDDDKSYAEAAKWYRKAIKQGKGSSIEKSAKEALRISVYNLGINYYNKQQYLEAFRAYKESAELGYANAQCDLGYLYDNGYGIRRDYIKAVKWYRKAAEQGNKIAQYDLGLCYRYGTGVAVDFEKAVGWYRKSAEQGYADAQYVLGDCYENGIVVNLDLYEARKWYTKTSEQGHEDAKAALKRVNEIIYH